MARRKFDPRRDVTLADLVNFYNAKISTINQLWGFLGVFAVASVTVVWSHSGSMDEFINLRNIIVVAYVGFAVVHWFTLMFSEAGLDEIRSAVRARVKSVSIKKIKKEVRPIVKRITSGTTHTPYLIGHIVLDLVVVCVILLRAVDCS